MDIGTGSGRFIYETARRLPCLFCVGIDAVSAAMRHYSAKSLRKPSRGGVANAVFVRSGVEDLPRELVGLATQVTVNLPWGGLLQGIVLAQATTVQGIRSIAAPGATLELLLAYDRRYESHMVDGLGLPELTKEYLEQHMAPQYAGQGITILAVSTLETTFMKALPLDWGRKLAYGRERQFFHVLARLGDAKEEQQAQEASVSSVLRTLASASGRRHIAFRCYTPDYVYP